MVSRFRPLPRGTQLLTLGVVMTMLLSLAIALVREGPTLGSPARDAAALSSSIEYVPSTSGTQLVRQPDGTLIRANLTPATQGGLFETAKGGFSIARDARGYFHYVTGRSVKGGLELSDEVVGTDPAPAGLQAHAGRRATVVDPAEQQIRDSILRQLQVASYRAQMKALAAGHPRIFRVPALMLATWWDPSKGQTGPQFQPGHSAAFYKRLLSGFGGNPRGSVTQFYWESSFGQFLVKVDVYGPFTSNLSRLNRCYYGGLGGKPLLDDPIGSVVGAGGGGALGLALEALPQADPVVNFAKYDNNGDGKVDFTIILHSGADMAVTGDPCNTWSHALQATLGQGEALEQTLGLPPGTLARLGLPTTDGVTIDRVLTIPEFGSPAEPLTIGVASHEMAHSLGEPDYYDTTYNSVGTGDFDVMAGGSYLGSPSGSNPTLMSPATRVFQGWVKPRIVHSSLRDVTLQPRSLFPRRGYTVRQTDPNLLLVPTYEVKLGGTDKTGHVWTQFDVTGLPKDPKTNAYVVEGFYVENVQRMAHGPAEHSGTTRGAIFDRKQHSSGLMVWHFDYWKRSNTLYGGNDAQTDSDRYQMDVEEFDQNDNTQELQLNYSRGNPSDFLQGAATGITSGTRLLPPGTRSSSGHPQGPVDLSGASAPGAAAQQTFVVKRNPNNASMTVMVRSDNPLGDCKLQLTDPHGTAKGEVDSGGAGAPETYTVQRPTPGKWTVTVGDFAACLQWSGTVRFAGAGGYTTKGAADTWSNWTHRPTGWAFTNVTPRATNNGLDQAQESKRNNAITLDVLDLGGRRDVSPGFITGAPNGAGGTTSVNVGQSNRMSVPVFSNGSKRAGKVTVAIREGSPRGRVVAVEHVRLGGYDRKNVHFRYQPREVGPFALFATVDPKDRVKEASEANNVQRTEGWAGPRVRGVADAKRVLVVDDDGLLTEERAVTGALATLGVPYAVVTEHPTYKQMRSFAAVIWEAANDRGPGQVTAKDLTQLTRYVRGGGKLMLSSNRIIDALATGPSDTTPQATVGMVKFAAQYLGVVLPNTSYVATQENVVPVSGHGLLKGVGGRIAPAMIRPFIGFGALANKAPTSQGTRLRPFGKVSPVLSAPRSRFPAIRATATPWLGVAVDGNAKHHRFQTVTMGFNLGQATNADLTVDVVHRVMRHFDVPLHQRGANGSPVIYDAVVRDQVSGRATPITAIVTGRHVGKVTLHYRTHGKATYRVLRMKPGKNDGVYSAVIPGRFVTPDGVDYFIQAGRSYSPHLAKPHRIAHAIGVQLPEVSKRR